MWRGSRFPGRGRCGRESVPVRASRRAPNLVPVALGEPGPRRNINPKHGRPHDPKVQNKARNKMLRCHGLHTKRRDQAAEQHMRVLPISLSGYHRKICGTVLAAFCLLLASWALPECALAQPHVQPPKEIAPAPSPFPGFWDPRRRPERPDLSRLAQIRFMTETDYPPFNYAGPDGHPIGFNVDLARMICEELKITCTIQMRRFDTLVPALNENRGEAVIASIAVTAGDAQGDRFHRSLLPRAGALRRPAQDRHRPISAGTARGQEGRGGRRQRA